MDGIRAVKEEHGIDTFDAALLDGSEFAGPAVLEDVYGATWLVLDDIRSIKNHANYTRLRGDDAYTMTERSTEANLEMTLYYLHPNGEVVTESGSTANRKCSP